MPKKLRYDEEEIALIEQLPHNYLGNLSQGFRELAVKLNRTPDAIRVKYYLLMKEKLEKNNYSFIMVSKKQRIPNYKIIRDNSHVKAQRSTSTIWQKLRKLLKF